MISKQWQVRIGILLMCVFFMAGLVEASTIETKQLELEVRLLYFFNQLNLTNNQIDSMISIINAAQAVYQKSQEDYENILSNQKELLLQKKLTEAQELEDEKRIIRAKAELEIKTILLDLELVFSTEQKEKIANMIRDRIQMSSREKQVKEPRETKKNIDLEPNNPNQNELKEGWQKSLEKRRELLSELKNAESEAKTEILQELNRLNIKMSEQINNRLSVMRHNFTYKRGMMSVGQRLNILEDVKTFPTILNILEEMKETI